MNSKKQKCLNYHQANPNTHYIDIAAAVGCDPTTAFRAIFPKKNEPAMFSVPNLPSRYDPSVTDKEIDEALNKQEDYVTHLIKKEGLDDLETMKKEEQEIKDIKERMCSNIDTVTDAELGKYLDYGKYMNTPSEVLPKLPGDSGSVRISTPQQAADFFRQRFAHLAEKDPTDFAKPKSLGIYNKRGDKSKAILSYLSSHPETTAKQCGEALHVSSRQVYKMINRNKMSNNEIEQKPDILADKKKAILTYLMEHPTAAAKEIATEVKCDVSYVYMVLNKRGLRIVKSRKVSNIRPVSTYGTKSKMVIDWIKSDPTDSIEHTAEMCGTTLTYTRQIINRYNKKNKAAAIHKPKEGSRMMKVAYAIVKAPDVVDHKVIAAANGVTEKYVQDVLEQMVHLGWFDIPVKVREYTPEELSKLGEFAQALKDVQGRTEPNPYDELDYVICKSRKSKLYSIRSHSSETYNLFWNGCAWVEESQAKDYNTYYEALSAARRALIGVQDKTEPNNTSAVTTAANKPSLWRRLVNWIEAKED